MTASTLTNRVLFLAKTLAGDTPITRSVTISPDDAEEILQSQNFNNRPMRMQWVKQIAATITRMGHLPQGSTLIAFSKEGQLVDGQHRMKAISISGVPCDVMVMFNYDKTSLGYQDNGLTRSIPDTAHYLGVKMTNLDAAVTRNFITMPQPRRIPQVDVIAAFDKYRDAINFAVEMRGIAKMPSAALAAFARGWYLLKGSDIRRMVEICGYQNPIVSDEQLVTGQTFAKTIADYRGHLRQNVQSDVYMKTCRAMIAFYNHQPITILRTLKEDPLPLSEVDALIEEHADNKAIA